ncbi:MAG TPA: DUF2231 domain-containing protein [Gammaproteobacteria bacterium]|nr:DUF2231 domain-containing protein [Gammaproteobacteria bacterium]
MSRAACGAPPLHSRALPIALSAIGVLLLGISGWLGGELVYVHGVFAFMRLRAPEGTYCRRRRKSLRSKGFMLKLRWRSS